MADFTIPNGPASPETPITLLVDGEIDGPDLVRRLAHGGLEMRNVPDAAGNARWVLIQSLDEDPVSAAACKARSMELDEHVQSENARLQLRHAVCEIHNLARQARSVAEAITEIEQLENERNSAGECIFAVLTLLDLIAEKCERAPS